MGNDNYDYYIPDKVKTLSLSRDFLLTVSDLFILLFTQLIAYVDAELYKKLYIISKEEISKRNSNKWKDYQIIIDDDIIEKLNAYNLIEQ